MYVLHKYPAMNGQPNLSPFSLKLEAWLRLAGLPYREAVVEGPEGAPKGQVPWLTLPDGTVISDTVLIVPHLRGRAIDPDAWMTDAQRGMAAAVMALAEERLIAAMLRFLWVEEAGFAVLCDAYFGDLPQPMREEVAGGWRGTVRTRLWGQGYGRHTADEVAALAAADIAALAAILGDNPWLFGNRPSTADCSTWAILMNLATPVFDTPMSAEIRASERLAGYLIRDLERWFPELA